MAAFDYSLATEIEAPPDRVWAIMRDVEHWPQWTASVKRVRLLDRGPLRVGSRAMIFQPKLPPARWRVTEFDDAGRRFTWISAAPGIRVIASHWVEARGAASRGTLTLRFEGVLAGLFDRLLRDLNNRYLAIEGAGLKQRSETARGAGA
jgi:uncharacterized membrane protein